MADKTYYITTPIYYPSDKLHIGNAYTTIVADTMARYKKLRGFDTRFLTGTDEHGQKIEKAAKAKGMTEMAFLDEIIAWIKDLWQMLDIEYDYFIRTTDEEHKVAVQKIFKKLYEKGYIYKGHYEGLYCTPDEAFFTERQAVGGVCPDCGRPVQKVQEEAYFFQLSKFTQPLLDLIEANPDFIYPETRRNEMVQNFLKPGLEDLCVSRTSFKWGIPVDFDPGHVVYVWIDALSNYITKLGYLSDNDADYQKYWPADCHLVGKEIVRFHTLIWPAILMALDLPLPKQVYGHGWLTYNGQKMSKSLGNCVDPMYLVETYGVDAVRYFVLREIIFGQDGVFSEEGLIKRINSDLANDLGNLLTRTVGMIDKYFGGQLPVEHSTNPFEADFIAMAEKTVACVAEHMDAMRFSDALNDIWTLVRRANKYADETQPWVLFKDETRRAELAGVMYALAEVLRMIGVMISPIMPRMPKHIIEQLNIPTDIFTWDSIERFGKLSRDVRVTKGSVPFPRIEVKKEKAPEQKKPEKAEKPSKPAKHAKPAPPAEISIDAFAQVEMKVGTVKECKKVENSDKLLCLQIQTGADEVRQIVSGIAKFYEPEALVGKQVIVCTNLKPVKLAGVMSYGMVLAASDENGVLRLVTPDGAIDPGATVS